MTISSQRMYPQSMINTLPLLISVPHGGYGIPSEIGDDIALCHRRIFFDGDCCTRKIYDLEDEVLYFHSTSIARAVVDLNRSEDDLPPGNPDGVIKSHSVAKDKVYRKYCFPGVRQKEELLKKYYFPYHRSIQRNICDPRILCCLDCHSMLDFLPDAYPDPQLQRPFICLSNGGDENGEGNEEELTCPPELIHILSESLKTVFPAEKDDIVFNTPFMGGHISRYHSRVVPWIQVEINRRAYLQSPWFNPVTLEVAAERIEELRTAFLQAFTAFSTELENLYQMPQNSLISHPFHQTPANHF